MPAPTFLTLPREIRQKILGYAFQGAIHIDLLQSQPQEYGKAKYLLLKLHRTARALISVPNAALPLLPAKSVVQLFTTVAALGPECLADCMYIGGKVVLWAEGWEGRVKERGNSREFMDAFVATFKTGDPREAPKKRAELQKNNLVSIEEFFCGA